MRLRLLVEYDGTEFAGWQVQRGDRTVQGVLEAAVERLTGRKTRVSAAGRTDAGVHASGQVVCFDCERAIEPRTVLAALNALTPHDISIRSVEVVPAGFDPRRAARSRTYAYRILNRAVPSPFWKRYAWFLRQPLDVEAMQTGASHLIGEHDFSSFRAAGCDAAHPVRRVLRSELRREGDLIVYEIEATAFLRQMVRTIVGTLVEVGLGKRRAEDVEVLLARRDRMQAGPTAPARGLCLTEVKY